MNALVLNGALKDDRSIETVNRLIEKMLIEKGYEVESILLHEKKIGECLGCFGCWIKTPGICVIDDYGRTLTENIINSDVVIYLTSVVFGGYSSELKKAIDRVIPLLLPFFKKVNGEVHHKERYKRYPKVIVLGIMEDEDYDMKETFNSLIKRNSLNWYNSFSGGTVQNNLEEDMKYQIEDKLRAMEVSVC
ncbi:NADPH-dependent FMN reductase [Anaerovirgula multivorans]|uniref:NADPH-dependent FMN reductase n=1 Tax=Anaerovirgula multivorans TaxID=312168 RepID=A0A239CCR3_9FIRM|nr:flavodoxin family protein [Anaerovirgula multivorans]SNS18007.1 NADPH-dependent FMN reductase [Anaerovirgula multivorans]